MVIFNCTSWITIVLCYIDIHFTCAINPTVLFLLSRRLEILKKLTQKKRRAEVIAQLIHCFLAGIRTWVWCLRYMWRSWQGDNVCGPRSGDTVAGGSLRTAGIPNWGASGRETSFQQLGGFWRTIQGYSPYTYACTCMFTYLYQCITTHVHVHAHTCKGNYIYP